MKVGMGKGKMIFIQFKMLFKIFISTYSISLITFIHIDIDNIFSCTWSCLWWYSYQLSSVSMMTKCKYHLEFIKYLKAIAHYLLCSVISRQWEPFINCVVQPETNQFSEMVGGCLVVWARDGQYIHCTNGSFTHILFVIFYFTVTNGMMNWMTRILKMFLMLKMQDTF